MDSDVRYYLKASPLEAGERSRLDNALTEDYYFKHLYAHSDEAEKKINEILNKIKRENVHNFILAGYKGCGKSTFVRYFLRKLKIRNRIINFDDNWDPDMGIINNLVSYLDMLIYDDLFPKDGEEACRTVRKYIELFCENDENNYRIRTIDTKNYFLYFGDKIQYALLCKNDGKNKKLLKYFDTDIKSHIMSGTISNLLMLMLFWDIADRIANNLSEKCCIVFENLDVIYNTKDVPNFAENVVAFRNNVDKLVPTLKYNGELLGSPTQNYILIFVMRETTEGEFASYIEHFSDRKVYFQPYTDISTVYNIHSIVSKRLNWLKELSVKREKYLSNNNIIQIRKKSNLILRLLDDDYLRKHLFGLFNNDYRTFVEVLSAFDLDDSKFFHACDVLLKFRNTEKGIDIDKNANKDEDKIDDNWPAFGYRSIIFREVFNIFVKEGYIDRLRSFEYSERTDGNVRSINLDRMILLYLSNSVSNKMVPEDQKDWNFVSLDKLFSEVTKFCKRSDSIVDALWQMYDLRKENKWNHLVTFENMRVITHEELQREMKAFENRTSTTEFAKVKITLAGENYLNHILPHFEFYAARASKGNDHSLFTFSAEEWCNMGLINNIFRNQRKEIRDCCMRLYRFFTDIFNEIPEYRGRGFLESNFAAIKYSTTRKSISKMYHCERIIHSNIGYVNRLRFYIAYVMDGVLKNKGFKEDVDITVLLSWYQHIDKSLKKLWPNNVPVNKIDRCIILEKNKNNGNMQKMCIKLKNEDETEVEAAIQLTDCVQIIKACLNARLIDIIKGYMEMFGIPSGKQCSMYSDSTRKLCDAFWACITEKIIPSGYTDFETQIDAATGNEILKRKKAIERQKNDQQRHKESQEKYALMKKEKNRTN